VIESPLPRPVADPERADLTALLQRLGSNHPDPFLTEITVAAGHLSRVIPHCNNVEILKWIDRAAELHAASVGEDRAALAAQHRAWFVARHEVDYRAEAFEGDRLVVATWVRSARRSIAWRDSLVVRPADRTVICSAATLWVHLDLRTRRPLAPPAATGLSPPEQPGMGPA
jgi:acyl-CoA thioester hydrolase